MPNETRVSNSLAEMRPDLAAEFDCALNAPKTPETVKLYSNKKYWWSCENGHRYLACANNRVGKHEGCPYCANRRVFPGFNDLATLRPDVAAEWDADKNAPLTAENVLPGSRTRAWFRCERGHSYQATVVSRTNGRGCPYCAGLLAIPGENDLATVYPLLVRELDAEKNAPLTARELKPHSKRKVFWRCAEGHSYAMSPHHRTQGSGCPVCARRAHTTLAEYIVLWYLEQTGARVEHCYTAPFLGKREIDFFLPEHNIGIEYDDYHHMETAKQDAEKNRVMTENGIRPLRIRCADLPPLPGCAAVFEYEELTSARRYTRLTPAIAQLIAYLAEHCGTESVPCIDVAHDLRRIRRDHREYVERYEASRLAAYHGGVQA